MKIIRYIVSEVDISAAFNSKPKIIGTFYDEPAAYAFARERMQGFIDDATDDTGKCDYVIDDSKWTVEDSTGKNGVQLSIQEVELALTKHEIATLAEIQHGCY